MDVTISLEDIDGVSGVEVSNADDENYVWITLRDNKMELVVKLSINELKLALKKIGAK